MNFKYLFEDDESFEKLLGGEKVDKKIVYFDCMHEDRLFVESLISSLELTSEQVGEVESRLKLIREEDESEHQIDKLFFLKDISNRYLMIKNMLAKEKELSFGILGLLFYLGLTCFDSLGQNYGYRTFKEWLVWKKNDEIKKLQSRIDKFEDLNLRKELAYLFDEIYNPNYGVKNQFMAFLNSIKEKDSYKNLMSSIELGDHTYQKKT
jgi:hypothetical protein